MTPTPTPADIEAAQSVAAEWALLHLGNTGPAEHNVHTVLPRLIAAAIARARAEGHAESARIRALVEQDRRGMAETLAGALANAETPLPDGAPGWSSVSPHATAELAAAVIRRLLRERDEAQREALEAHADGVRVGREEDRRKIGEFLRSFEVTSYDLTLSDFAESIETGAFEALFESRALPAPSEPAPAPEPAASGWRWEERDGWIDLYRGDHCTDQWRLTHFNRAMILREARRLRGDDVPELPGEVDGG